jgi:CheY-like chemotaxis protein
VLLMKILIADDKQRVRRAIRSLLESHHGWDVREAEDGAQAVVRAREDKPDVVVLDLAMPGLNGFEAARQIASSLPGVPIFLNTLYASAQVDREAERLGVQRVISKSEEYRLIPAIEEALASRTVH